MQVHDPEPASCPCGWPRPYGESCGRLHRGEKEAATAEELMRSRYSAFAVADRAYLRHSWHPSTCPRRIHVDDAVTWLALEVLAATGGDLFDDEGTVAFRAHHRRGGDEGALHEVSRFSRLDGRWVYVGPAGAFPDVGLGSGAP